MSRKKIKHHGENSLNGTLFGPTSEWSAPSTFPNLRGVRRIGLDIESRDPNLTSRGPGFIRKDAEVTGISLATDDAKWYFPFGHLGGGNLDRDIVTRFVSDVLLRGDVEEVVGANLQYELEGLWSLGINPLRRVKYRDIQIAECLLDEERDDAYDLGTLCKLHLGTGKDETLLREAASAYGIDPKKDLWKLPSKYVGPYAEYDAFAALKIYDKQREKLAKEDLMGIFEIETELLPLLWEMRLQGIPVDLDEASKLSSRLKAKEDELRLRMRHEFGRDIDVWSGPAIASKCKDLGIIFRTTSKGNASFTSEWIDGHTHPFITLIGEIRELDRLRGTFVDKWIFDNQVNGRIHCQWKQLKSDEGGTRTGRMAASNPNPQQVPSRSELAPLLRAIFRYNKWFKGDYSQQEPRLLVHFAYLCGFKGAAEIRDAYIKDPAMRIYKMLSEMAGISDRQSKDLTLGRCYGMGKAKLAFKLGVREETAQGLLDKFDAGVPFVKDIAESCMNVVQKRGWIKTICGRKRHFNYWEPVDSYQMRKDGHDTRPLPLELAQQKWPTKRLQRANTHKALNALIQGSAADMTKVALIKFRKELNVIPFMAIHDEIDAPCEGEEHGKKMNKVMETAVEMTVPLKVGGGVYDHWK